MTDTLEDLAGDGRAYCKAAADDEVCHAHQSPIAIKIGDRSQDERQDEGPDELEDKGGGRELD